MKRWALCVCLLAAMQTSHAAPAVIANSDIYQMLLEETLPASFLGLERQFELAWQAQKTCMPQPPSKSTLAIGSFTQESERLARQWLAAPMDDDNMLRCRLDGCNDEVGRVQDALRTRLSIHTTKQAGRGCLRAPVASRNQTLFDARCLQDASLLNGTIGAFALAALDRMLSDGREIVLLIDPAQNDVPSSIKDTVPTVDHVPYHDVHKYGFLVQPSPMTHSPEPLLPIIRASTVRKIAFVYDFIPLQHADAYLRHFGERAEYAVRHDALLRFYEHYIAASNATERELVRHLESCTSRQKRYTTRVAVPSEFVVAAPNKPEISANRLSYKHQRQEPVDSSRHSRSSAPVVSGEPSHPASIAIFTGLQQSHNAVTATALLSKIDAGTQVYIVGMEGGHDKTVLREWMDLMRAQHPQLHVLDKLDAESEASLLRRVDLAVVPCFTEALGRTVGKAVQAGIPVVASDTPLHRELLGKGTYLVRATDVDGWANAVKKHSKNRETAAFQMASTALSTYELLEDVVAEGLRLGSASLVNFDTILSPDPTVQTNSAGCVDKAGRRRNQVAMSSAVNSNWRRNSGVQHAAVASSTSGVVVDIETAPSVRAAHNALPPKKHYHRSSNLHRSKNSKTRPRARQSIGIVTPWPPQMSGIAAFSRATAEKMARVADVTVYVTADAGTSKRTSNNALVFKPVNKLLDSARNQHNHDALIAVIGNSHFHVPALQVIRNHNCDIILHDTRLADLYSELRGLGGLDALMKKAKDVAHQNHSIALREQLLDFTKLQNYATWEVARLAKRLIMHAPLSSGIIARQTGVTPVNLPFATYLTIPEDVGADGKSQARRALGFDAFNCTHISTFGSLNQERKRCLDLLHAVVEVGRRGHAICMHFVGTGEEKWHALVRDTLKGRLAAVNITGFVNEDLYLQYIMATDLGVQLRDSPYLGPSGALADMSAAGTTGLGSNGIAVDTDCPGFIDRLPQTINIASLADAIEYRILHQFDYAFVQAERLEYARKMSPSSYSDRLLKMLAA
jgi:glycosyltransferase involved in cell wall biosynthesis